MTTERTAGSAGNKRRPRKRGVPLALALVTLALAAGWAGLTLAGRSVEKPDAAPSPGLTAQSLRDFDYAAAGALDPDSPEWAERYGAGHPKAVTPGAVPSDAPAAACRIAVTCHTAVDRGMAKQEQWQGIVPPDGVIVAPAAVEFRRGETAFDVLKRVLRERDIQMEFSGLAGTRYIKGIHNLYEFDGGPDSGWMFSVNGWFPNYGCGQYAVEEGDVIEWRYTCDLGRDLGQDWIVR